MAVIVQLTLPETLFEEVRTELNQRDHDHGVTEDPTCGNGGARRVFARHGWWRDAEILFGGLYGDLSAGGGQQWELARRTPVVGGWYKVGKPVSQGVVDALHGRDSGLSDLWIRHRVRPTVGLEHAVLQGDGILVSAENAVMGVAIAVISFVGSMGNVPFAVALWGGGVSFAGVIAFVYADLITVPVLNVYRKYYGWSVMLYILGVFFVTMVSSRGFSWNSYLVC